MVNVTLVDIRAWDTMGELAVLVVAATGVASLIFERSRTGPRPRRPESAPAGGGHGRPVWLRGGPTLHEERRSIVLEVVIRLIFHTVVLFSLFLLFSGHNAPGGGFAGGLVAGLALVVRYLAGGRYELTEAAPVGAGPILGAGLAMAVGSGVVALLLGGSVLESAKVDQTLPLVGDIHLVDVALLRHRRVPGRDRAGAGHPAQPRRRGGPAHRGHRNGHGWLAVDKGDRREREMSRCEPVANRETP